MGGAAGGGPDGVGPGWRQDLSRGGRRAAHTPDRTAEMEAAAMEATAMETAPSLCEFGPAEDGAQDWGLQTGGSPPRWPGLLQNGHGW